MNGPLVVAVADPSGGVLRQLERGIAADPQVASVAEPVRNEAGDAAVITVTPEHGPQDDATRALVDRLRDDVIPETGAEAYVGGRTARFGDEAERIASRIPLFAAAVVGMSLLLLLVAFRSWRVSLLSAAFNLASIAAAYGVVVLAFQTGTGASLLGVEQLPVVPYVPLFMFAILFGLSTDYNVFLLSRVREEWGRHADHRDAIAAATARTRRIITAAGGVMVAVFLGFATDPDPVIKMTGVGLATAVLVDVTLVRLLMAPAALSPVRRPAVARPPPDPACGDGGGSDRGARLTQRTRNGARREPRGGRRSVRTSVLSRPPPVSRPVSAAMPPPTTKPATAAPISTSLRRLLICLRQSVTSVTSERRRSTARPSSARLASIERRISSAVRISAISAPPPPGPGGRRRRPSASRPDRRSAWP